MPSTSAAQHRWIAWQATNPEARKQSGLSKSKAEEWLHADRGSPWKHATGGIVQHRDSGGDISTDPSGIGGIQPSSANANPLTQSAIQRYASMSTEQLAELAGRLGSTSQGQIVQQLLQQRRMTPQASQTLAQPQQRQAQPVQPTQTAQIAQQPIGQSPALRLPDLQAGATSGMKRGGAPQRQTGGMSSSEQSPWWTRREASQAGGNSGLLHGVTGGRADQIATQAPAGAYIIPADVVAGLGQGNNLAGARIMSEIIKSQGPFGVTGMQRRGGSSIPRAPATPRDTSSSFEGLERGGHVPVFNAVPRAAAGGVPETHNSVWSDGQPYTAVDLSDGEFVVHPEDVDRIGAGDRKRGHRLLDKWVVDQRAKHIKELKALKPPVGSRVKKKVAA